MYIEYLGHSCFYLKGEEFSVVTDPFGGIGIPLKRVKCDYALSSHDHFDHNNFSGVDAKRSVTSSFGNFKAIECFHDDAFGQKRGKNRAFYFNIDGLNVLHLGDLGEPFSEENAKKFLLPADVLFIPVGGRYTIDAAEAARYARAIGAEVTIPMHYKTRGNLVDVAPVDEFLKIVGKYERVANGFELTKRNIGDFCKTTVIDFD